MATITNDADAYAKEVAGRLKAAGLRVETDLRNEKINYKVREHSLAKVPVIAVVGRREERERTVAVRRLGGEEQEILALDDAVATTTAEATAPGACESDLTARRARWSGPLYTHDKEKFT